MYRLMKYFLTIFFIFLLIGCTQDEEVTFVSATHAPETKTLTGSIPLQVSVTGHYSDGSTKDLTNTLIWSSSDESIATVVDGLITPKDSDGTVVITYTSQDTLPDGTAIFSTSITYESRNAVLKSLSITPSGADIFVGETLSFAAIGIFETSAGDESVLISNECDWSSADSALLKMEDELGTGLSVGETSVHAVYKSNSAIFADSNVSILENSYNSISVSSEQNSFNVGENLQFEAIGTSASDSQIVITDQVNWSTSDSSIVSIDSSGVATALGIGDEVEIVASLDGKEGSSSVSVKRENYLQLFDLDEQKQLKFPYYAEYHTDDKEDITQPEGTTVLANYGLVAVGKSFTISDIKYSDFNNTDISIIEFDGLRLNQTILKGETVEFSLVYKYGNVIDKQLRFSFSVEGESVESFVSTYEITP